MVQEVTKIGMPLEEFIELSNEQPFELINGERKPKLPNIYGHNEMISILLELLVDFVRSLKLGFVYPELTFILPGTDEKDWVSGSRIPDIAFYVAERINLYKAANPDHMKRPLALVPDMVIEVVSECVKHLKQLRSII
jgi:Uma2 family endonuclease